MCRYVSVMFPLTRPSVGARSSESTGESAPAGRATPARGHRPIETGAGMGRRKAIQRVALAAAVALGASACLSSNSGGGGGSGGGGKAGDGNVEVVFGFGGSQSTGFRAAFAEWQKTSGIKIKFTEASQSFDTLIRTRVQANNAPDIALFPQPGILKDFVKQGKMTDLSTQLDVNKLQSDMV